jgi:hypothetical protein
VIRLPQWQFIENENHEWRWVSIRDDVRVVSAHTFADRSACLLDALQSAGIRRDAPQLEPGSTGETDLPRLRLSLHDPRTRPKSSLGEITDGADGS